VVPPVSVGAAAGLLAQFPPAPALVARQKPIPRGSGTVAAAPRARRGRPFDSSTAGRRHAQLSLACWLLADTFWLVGDGLRVLILTAQAETPSARRGVKEPGNFVWYCHLSDKMGVGVRVVTRHKHPRGQRGNDARERGYRAAGPVRKSGAPPPLPLLSTQIVRAAGP